MDGGNVGGGGRSGGRGKHPGTGCYPADKEKALVYLETAKKGVLALNQGFERGAVELQARSRQAVGGGVHGTHRGSGRFDPRNVCRNAMKAPAVPDIAKVDAGIMAMVPDRTMKPQALEPLKPTNRFGSLEASIKHFLVSRAKTEEFLKTTPDLRGHVSDRPIGTKWDAYEFVLFIAAHSERHTKQIEEVNANPNFPVK